MNPIFSMILQMIGRKQADKMLARRDAEKAAIERGEITKEELRQQKKQAGLFYQFWALDVQKSFGQAFITYMFYSFVLGLMDNIALFPIMHGGAGTGDARDIVNLIMDYPPSLFVGLALIVVVLLGRDIAIWKKILPLAIGAGVGVFYFAPLVMVPIIYLLMQPVDGDIETDETEIAAETEAGQIPPEQVLATSPAGAMDPAPAAQQQTQQQGDPAPEAEAAGEPEKKPDGAGAQASAAETENESESAPSDDKDPPVKTTNPEDDFVDPLDEFIKRPGTE